MFDHLGKHRPWAGVQNGGGLPRCSAEEHGETQNIAIAQPVLLYWADMIPETGMPTAAKLFADEARLPRSPGSNRHQALCIQLDRPEGVAGSDEQDVVLGATEAEIGRLLGHQKLANQLAAGIENMNAIEGSHVDIAVAIQAHPIGKTR